MTRKQELKKEYSLIPAWIKKEVVFQFQSGITVINICERFELDTIFVINILAHNIKECRYLIQGAK